jgi:hypothetical protein
VKIGDLVKTVVGFHRRGLLVKRIHDPLAQRNKVFKILWVDGTMGNNVWDYDLEVISESR